MSSKELPKLIVILGPTGTGKTNLAVKLARRFKGEIISADSRQIYQDMNIGTGKDLSEYVIKSEIRSVCRTGRNSKSKKKYKNIKISYHLIDIIKPTTHFNVAKFKIRAERVIKDIQSRGKIPFLVGGTGLYISALIENYQFPKQTKSKYQTLQLGLTFPKKDLDQRIDKRVDKMIKNGLVNETKKLLKKYNKNFAPLRTIGYAEIIDYLNKKTTLNQAVDLIKIHTHQFAKRQMTWFQRDKKIKWIKDYKQVEKLVKEFLEK